MIPLEQNIENAFRSYAELELRRHKMLSEEIDEGHEAEDIEAQMDLLWEKLDEAQRQKIKGMGSDLNWVRRNGALPPNGNNDPSDVSEKDKKELLELIKSNDWEKLLRTLRICAPVLEKPTLAYFRGECYSGLNFPEYAAIFYKKAIDFLPTSHYEIHLHDSTAKS